MAILDIHTANFQRVSFTVTDSVWSPNISSLRLSCFDFTEALISSDVFATLGELRFSGLYSLALPRTYPLLTFVMMPSSHTTGRGSNRCDERFFFTSTLPGESFELLVYATRLGVADDKGEKGTKELWLVWVRVIWGPEWTATLWIFARLELWVNFGEHSGNNWFWLVVLGKTKSVFFLLKAPQHFFL